MTDLTEWIKERRRIHGAATEGPWWTTRDLRRTGVFAGQGVGGDPDVAVNVHTDDATAIVDARNRLPTALTALEKVLEEHPRQGLYEPCIPKYCCGEDIHEHIETDSGEWVHADDQIGWACFTCRTEDGESSDWPCPTVQAIEGAIK